MPAEPLAREARDDLERAGLREEMARARHDLQLLFADAASRKTVAAATGAHVRLLGGEWNASNEGEGCHTKGSNLP